MTQSPDTPALPRERFKTVRAHTSYALCVLATVVFIFWAALGTLDIVSMATGEVVPASQIKTVQHLEGGIVSFIHVKEGDFVQLDQPLVVLEPTSSDADVGELQVRLTSLKVQIARLEAQLAGWNEPKYDAQLISDHAALVRRSQERFAIQSRRRKSEILQQKKAILQRRYAINETTQRIRGHRKSLSLLKEQVGISEQLLKDNLTNRYKHLDLLKENGRLEGELEESKAALVSAKASLAEAQAGLAAIKSVFDDETKTELDAARLTFDELTQRMRKFEDSLARTTLRSPVNGLVKTMYIATIGGVVRAGEPVVDIVPQGDMLIIEAKLATQDIGFVQSGQLAKVTLASADAQRFGGLEGKVISVSPDTLLTPEGSPFYKVRIETDSDHFQRGEERYNLFPGMQVIANIHTGNRTVFQYLFQPFIDSMDDAMRER